MMPVEIIPEACVVLGRFQPVHSCLLYTSDAADE